MKNNNLLIILIIIMVGLFYECEKDPIEATNVKIVPSQTEITAKTPIVFNFEGNAEFMTFYSGIAKAQFLNYPVDKGTPVDMKVKSLTYNYTKPGIYTAVVVATSYGNYAKKESMVADSVTINVK